MRTMACVILIALCGVCSADYLGSWKIDDYVPIRATTHQFSTGAAHVATLLTYSIYEDANDAGIVEDVNMVPASPFDGVTGFYLARRQLTTAAGFEKGKNYTVLVKATVDGVSAITSHSFQIEAEVDTNSNSDKTGYGLADDAITAAKYDESTAFPITGNALDASELADTYDLDSVILANASVVAIKQTTDRVSGAMESDGSGGYQFTALALENGPGLTDITVRSALGMASADLDDQMDAIYADVSDMYSIFPSLATGTVGTAGTANSCTLSAAFSTVASAYPRGTLVKFTDATSGLSYVSRLTRYTTGRVLTVDPGFPVAPEVGDAVTMYAIVWPFFGF